MGERHKKWQIHTFLHKYTIYDAGKKWNFLNNCTSGTWNAEVFFTKRLVTICRHFILVLPSELLKSTPYSHVLMKHSFRFKSKSEFINCKKRCHTQYESHTAS